MGLGDGYSPWLPPTVSWKFVYAKEKKSSHVISDDIHSICPINRTCPLKKNNNKKKSSLFTFPFCSRGHGPYIMLAFFLLVTGALDLEGREWGDAFPFGGYCMKTELRGSGRNPLSPNPPAASPPATPEGPWTRALDCSKRGELYSGKQAQREQGCGRDGANWSKRFRQLETVALGKLSPKEPWETLRVWLQFGSPREDTAEPPLKQSQKSTKWINYQ